MNNNVDINNIFPNGNIPKYIPRPESDHDAVTVLIEANNIAKEDITELFTRTDHLLEWHNELIDAHNELVVDRDKLRKQIRGLKTWTVLGLLGLGIFGLLAVVSAEEQDRLQKEVVENRLELNEKIRENDQFRRHEDAELRELIAKLRAQIQEAKAKKDG